jgi:uncharacterized membrane protein
MMGWSGGAVGPLAGLAIIALWVILFALIVWAVGRLLPSSSDEMTAANSESAVEILDRQLADGEIDISDWQDRRSALVGTQEKSAPATPAPK